MREKVLVAVASMLLGLPPLLLVGKAVGDSDCENKENCFQGCESDKDCDGNGQPVGKSCAEWEWVYPETGHFECVGNSPGNKCDTFVTTCGYTWGNCTITAAGCVEEEGETEDCDLKETNSCTPSS